LQVLTCAALRLCAGVCLQTRVGRSRHKHCARSSREKITGNCERFYGVTDIQPTKKALFYPAAQ
jgi:hypothetical protein